MAGSDSLIGRTLGAYRIVEQIGQGGMATVYKAYEPVLDRYVAIKVLPAYFAHDPSFAARFEREAKAVAKLDHPNILPVYSFGHEGGATYLVMRYVEAGTLKDALLEGCLDLRATLDILRQVARALDYAHRQGIVHRDVKPSNVLIADGEWALLTDFGLARMVEGSPQITKTGVGIGTPAYMSPEQGQGKRVDARSDVYSLGIMLYEMLTDRVPYEAETPMAVVVKHIVEPLPLPRSIKPDLPEVVERVVLRALAKDPADRYQSAGEMVNALEQAVAESARPEGRVGGMPDVAAEGLPPVDTGPPRTVQLTPSPTVRLDVPPITRKGLPAWAWGGIALFAVLVAIGGILLATRARAPLTGVEATATSVVTPAVSAITPTRTEPTATPTPVVSEAVSTPVFTTIRVQVRFTSTSDWATLTFVSGVLSGHDTVETGGEPTLARMEDRTLRLIQPLERSEAGETVYIVEDVELRMSDSRDDIGFKIEQGCLGSATAELYNVATGFPVLVERLVSDDCSDRGATFSVSIDSLLAEEPSYVLASEVWIDFDAAQEYGIVLVDGIGDGNTALERIGGRNACATRPGEGVRYIYFDVDDSFIFAQATSLYVTVEYYDLGNAQFFVHYDSADSTAESDGLYKFSAGAWLSNSVEWRTATFELPDAYFAGRQHEHADFRIDVGDNDFYVSRVTVTKP